MTSADWNTNNRNNISNVVLPFSSHLKLWKHNVLQKKLYFWASKIVQIWLRLKPWNEGMLSVCCTLSLSIDVSLKITESCRILPLFSHLRYWPTAINGTKSAQWESSWLRRAALGRQGRQTSLCLNRYASAQMHETPTQRAPCYCPYDPPGSHTSRLADTLLVRHTSHFYT